MKHIEVQDQTDRRLLLAGLQHLNDELLYMVSWAFQLRVLCMLETNQKSAPVWDVSVGNDVLQGIWTDKGQREVTF